MQLKKPVIRPIAGQLAVATAATLGVTEGQARETWSVTSSVMVYQESDNRVSAVEPMLLATHTLSETSEVSVKVVYDSLTGASPNGAMPANRAQTFTSPSGLNMNGLEDDDDEDDDDEFEDDDDDEEGSYIAPAGKKPFDPSFEDTRSLIGIGWRGALSERYQGVFGFEYSTETDYESVSLNGTVARSFNGKNTDVSVGVNLEQDTIMPFGDVPTPLSEYANRQTEGTEATRELVDVLFGVTQVMTRRWLSQFNVSFSYSSGYQEDPYKILTVADDGNLMRHPAVEGTWRYAFESRPGSRLKTILYWRNKLALNNTDVLDVDGRFMTDDWGIRSGTLNVSWRWQATHRFHWEPHVRYYRQTDARFYTPFLRNGTDVEAQSTGLKALTEHASSDARLGAFAATTIGLKAGWALTDRHEWSIRAEQYQQRNRNGRLYVPSGSDLDGMEQFTELSAFWVQTSYQMRW